MKSFKVKLTMIIALAMVFVATLGAFLGITLSAKADRRVRLIGTSLFYTSGYSRVWAHREGKSEVEEEDDYYTMFAFREKSNKDDDDDRVVYRHNLAYSWFYDNSEPADTDDEGEKEAHPAKGYG